MRPIAQGAFPLMLVSAMPWAAAQDHAPQTAPTEHAGHAAQAMPTDQALEQPPAHTHAAPELPAAALAAASSDHAADRLFDPARMAAARAQLYREHGGFTTSMMLADRFESGTGDGPDRYRWDVQGWAGSDLHRFWWKTEGAGARGDNPDAIELQALYSRALTPFFDVQAGVRYDPQPGPQRTHAVLGIQGLLPYVFEIDAAVFLSDGGDWTARLEAEYDMRLQQRLVLQPRLELNFAAQAMPDLGIGAGLGSIDSGLRLRYEIRRELAPYVGIEWARTHGATADFARAAGQATRARQAVLGLRAWF